MMREVMLRARSAYTLLYNGVGWFHAVGSPDSPENAIAGIFAVCAAYAAAPTVPLKGTWMPTLEPTFGPVTAS